MLQQAAFCGNVAEQTRNMHRDERNDDVLEHTGHDALQIAAHIQQGGATQISHADAEHKRKHQRSHDTEDRFNLDGEKRLERVAFQYVTRDGLDQRGQHCLADQEGQKPERTVVP